MKAIINHFYNQIKDLSLAERLFLLLLLSLPFEHVLTFELKGFTIKLSHIIGLLFIIFFLPKIIRKKSWKFEVDEILLLLFAGWSFCTAFWSLGREYTIAISSIFLFMVGIFIVSGRILQRRIYFKALILMAVIISLFGFYQFLGQFIGIPEKYLFLSNKYTIGTFLFPRIQSTFYEPSFFANFLIGPIYLSIYFLSCSVRKYYATVLCIISLAFFLTVSRGAFISLIITLILLGLYLIWRRKIIYLKKLIPSLSIIFLSFLFSCFIIFTFAGREGATQYINQFINNKDVSSSDGINKLQATRGYTVSVALKNSIKHPFGVGTGAFGALPEFHENWEKYRFRQNVNSLYPEILIENGFIGLLLFLSFMIVILGRILKDNESIFKKGIIFSVVLAVFIQYFALSTIYLAYVWVFLALAKGKGKI